MPTKNRTAGELSIWRTPKCYAGFDPVGHIVIASMHRESSILAQSNYWMTQHRLVKVGNAVPVRLEDIVHDGPFSRFDPDEAPAFYDWQAGDSMVGWIRYLMISPKKASPALVKTALAIVEALKQYPILSDADYRERQIEAMESYWKSEPLQRRIDWCRENGTSIFAARRPYPPERVEEHWSEEMFA